MSELECLSLVVGEYVAERGMREVHWLVRQNDGWIHAAEVPGAVRVACETPPGTAWESRIDVTVPRGTRLLRVESKPAIDRRSPLEYLTSAPRATRAVRRTQFVAGPRGELRRAESA